MKRFTTRSIHTSLNHRHLPPIACHYGRRGGTAAWWSTSVAISHIRTRCGGETRESKPFPLSRIRPLPPCYAACWPRPPPLASNWQMTTCRQFNQTRFNRKCLIMVPPATICICAQEQRTVRHLAVGFVCFESMMFIPPSAGSGGNRAATRLTA